MGSRHRSRVYFVAAVTAVVALGTVSGVESAAAVVEPPTTSSLTVAPQLQVLTIGDSIMNGFGLADGESWPDLLGQAEGWSVTNLACDGAGVLQVGNANECDSDFAGVIASAATLDPDIVIFEGSSNDFGLSNDALQAATTAELNTIRAEFPDAQIVGLSTLWGYTTPPAQLVQINAQVQQAVEAVRGTYIDLGQPMSGHPELMQASDVHPTASGQAVLETLIQADLAPVALAATEQARAADEPVGLIDKLERLELTD